MTALEAGVIALAALMVLILVLLAAILRRLSEHERELAGLRPSPGIGVNERAPAFAATTLDGRDVSLSSGGETVLAFFAAGCSACTDTMPEFRRLAARAQQRGAQVLAIVAGTAESARSVIDALEGAVPTVLAPLESSTLISEYRLHAFPAYLAVGPDGIVTARAPTPAMLESAVAASLERRSDA